MFFIWLKLKYFLTFSLGVNLGDSLFLYIKSVFNLTWSNESIFNFLDFFLLHFLTLWNAESILTNPTDFDYLYIF